MYDYRKEMVDAIKEWIHDNTDEINKFMEEGSHDYFDLFDWIYDRIWDEDTITGNGAYGFTDEDACRHFVADNLDLYFLAALEFDDFGNCKLPAWVHENPGKHMDTTIRCYLLSECLDAALHNTSDSWNDGAYV